MFVALWSHPGHDGVVVVDRRLDAAKALVALAVSADFGDRADAGQGLALLVDLTESQAALGALVLDVHDTHVTVQTARALLATKDLRAYEVLAAAVGQADDSRLDYITTAVHDVLGVYASDLSAAMQLSARLEGHHDEETRRGAKILSRLFARVHPVLLPVGAFGVGNLYEDCAFHPVQCTYLSEEDDEMSGISLIDGSRPRGCSPRFCGPLPLIVYQAVQIKAHFEHYVAERTAGREPEEILGSLPTRSAP